MSLNSYLLSIFGKRRQFEVGLNSLAIHYQILSIIYIGFAVTFIVCLFELFNCAIFGSFCSFSLSITASVGFILSMLILKKGYRNTAGSFLMIFFHLANIMTGISENAPLAALLAGISFPSYSYFLTDTPKLVIFNNLLHVVEFSIYIRNILNIFHVTLTDEQYFQIISGLAAFVLVFTVISLLGAFQKSTERNLWRLLNDNYKNSENLTKEVVQAINAKDRFVSSLSHEVRNVLNSLNGSVDYLVSVLKDSPHLQILKDTKISGEILLNLVSNALDAAKIKADKLELSCDHANFEDVVKKSFLINSENFKSKNIFAKAVIDSRVPKNLWIDSGRLLQIMLNLISNALKFTPRGGQIRVDVLWSQEKQPSQYLLDPLAEDTLREISDPTGASLEDGDELMCEFSFDEEQMHHRNLTKLNTLPSPEERRAQRPLTLLCRSDSWQIQTINFSNSSFENNNQNSDPQSLPSQESGHLKVQVSDTGCGISKEKLPKLFEMYSQADHTVSSSYGGTGLGLWICKQLCHKMKGDITVHSQPDVGTKFVFYIPVHSSLQQVHSEEMNVNYQVNALVVDDHAFNRDLHKLLLEREGVQVVLAQDGQEAIQKFQEKSNGFFDFIFMDLNMPIIDGFAATKEIRRWEVENRRKRTMIYFVSGEYFNDSEVIEILKTTEGFVDTPDIKFLRKPIEVEMVAKIVKEHKYRHKDDNQISVF